MQEKESRKEDNHTKEHPLLELSKKVGVAIVKTLKHPTETKKIISTEIRRFRRLMRHKFYY